MSATAYPFREALSAVSVATSWTGKTPTATKPSGSGVFDIFDPALGYATDTYMPKFIDLQPWGTNANNESFLMRLYGWTKTKAAVGSELWIPRTLLDLTVTLGNIAATAIAADTFLADTIVVNYGDSDGNISTAADLPASIVAHLRAVHLIEFAFNLDTALTDGAGANCYWRLMDHC